MTETREHGCNEKDSPIRCLATAVRQKAAEISEECRSSTEKALPYACSVELFMTHCDGIEKPLIPCLEEKHPQLGPECVDFLTVKESGPIIEEKAQKRKDGGSQCCKG